MCWIKEISLWNTMLELKDNHPTLGFKDQLFFVSEFARELQADELKYIVSDIAFNGMHLGKGLTSFILSEEEIATYFKPSEKNFKQIQKEFREKQLQE